MRQTLKKGSNWFFCDVWGKKKITIGKKQVLEYYYNKPVKLQCRVDVELLSPRTHLTYTVTYKQA